MQKVNDTWIRHAEAAHPGFGALVGRYEGLPLPDCPTCGSSEVATVVAGLVQQTVHLAAATTRVKLVPNGRSGQSYCWSCQRQFEPSVV